MGTFFMSNPCPARGKERDLLSFLSIISCEEVLRMTRDDENAFLACLE